MPKSKTIRRWYYNAFDAHDWHINMEPEASEEEVRKILEERYRSGDWDPSSLRRGKKLKVRKAR